jgi:hypothetical protein
MRLGAFIAGARLISLLVVCGGWGGRIFTVRFIPNSRDCLLILCAWFGPGTFHYKDETDCGICLLILGGGLGREVIV